MIKNINIALLDISDGGTQGALALADACRAGCDECESLDVDWVDAGMMIMESRFRGEIIGTVLLGYVGMEGVEFNWEEA